MKNKYNTEFAFAGAIVRWEATLLSSLEKAEKIRILPMREWRHSLQMFHSRVMYF
jgi:hypothetical protein